MAVVDDPEVFPVVATDDMSKVGETTSDMANHHNDKTVTTSAETDNTLGDRVADKMGNQHSVLPHEGAGSLVEPPLPICLMFPGQGSQCVGMLKSTKDIPEVKAMLDQAKTFLGYDLLQLCLDGPEETLEDTRHCQLAVFVGGLAGVEKLRAERAEAVSRPQCMAGLSLGEYAALCAAGVFDFIDGLQLVQLRGEAMHEAAAVGKQAMLSVVGVDRSDLDIFCATAAEAEGPGTICQVANVLFPLGFVVAGAEAAVLAVRTAADRAGALQTKLLKTSGAFHTPYMKLAQDRLHQALENLRPKMRPPRCTVYMNATAKPVEAGTDPGTIVHLLNQQLVSPVLWDTLMQRVIKDGVTEFFECGPQSQLKAMMKRINKKAFQKTRSINV
eukprot:TRINITY_DN31180_c0_g1_i1.p1 TRINITY_DN31180_c0_g1~~TRINITY_DN31180_c0_g1_i1.p1  ORF type:complete len:428 (-),score=71.76 TRINITY_DN31180_c0_g1_i1:57-1214(-)